MKQRSICGHPIGWLLAFVMLHDVSRLLGATFTVSNTNDDGCVGCLKPLPANFNLLLRRPPKSRGVFTA